LRNGVPMAKTRNCSVCEITLTPPKTKFCSEKCYLQEKQAKAKKRIAMMRRMKPAIKCSMCNKDFFPLRADHTACSTPCSKQQAKQKRQDRLAKIRRFGRTKPMESIFESDIKDRKHRKIFLAEQFIPLSTLVTECTFNPSDKTKQEVQKFLENGGKITKFSDSPPNKTPDALPHTRQIREDMSVYGIEYEPEEIGFSHAS